jgi:hypothetical protein
MPELRAGDLVRFRRGGAHHAAGLRLAVVLCPDEPAGEAIRRRHGAATGGHPGQPRPLISTPGWSRR